MLSKQPVKGPRASRPNTRKVSIAAPSASDLQKQVGILTRELKDAREQQSATADVLKVISRSTFDLQAVLGTLVQSAGRLCQAENVQIFLRDGEVYHLAADNGFSPEYQDYVRQHPIVPGRSTLVARTALEVAPVHLSDALADPEYTYHEGRRLGGYRTMLGIPLVRDEYCIGVIVLTRSEVCPFTDKQVELVATFADQAVIAIENARLITETHEALEQQTATAEVLGLINSSLGDLAPVFDAILEKATRLCDAPCGHFRISDGELLHLVAARGVPEAYMEFLRTAARPHPDNPLARMLRGERVIVSKDVAAEELYRVGEPLRRAFVDLGKARSVCHVALVKDGQSLGTLSIYRQEVRPFADKQIALLQNFAAQAMIAMENARLITETREALERQTATSEVLGVINSSPGDLAPVFDAMLEKAMQLCASDFGFMNGYDGSRFKPVAQRGVPSALQAYFAAGPDLPGLGEAHTRVLAGEDLIHSLDYKDEDAYRLGNPLRRAVVDLGGARTALVVALRREGLLLGTMTIYRREVRPFTDKQIALLESFAAQAVIAMENARLLGELRARTDDLEESLEYQTATSDVLKVISKSGAEVEAVLDTLVNTAARLCDAQMAFIHRREDGVYRPAAVLGFSLEFAAYLESHPLVPGRGSIAGRVALERRPIHILDVTADPEYELSQSIVMARQRTALGVPLLLANDEPIGVIVLARQRVQAFTEKEISLVATFADQAVIAIENARLLGELRARTDDLEQSLEYQTATSDVLKVISRSTFDLQPVLDTLVETAARLCAAEMGMIAKRDDKVYRTASTFAFSPEFRAVAQHLVFEPGRSSVIGRAAEAHAVVQVEDIAADQDYALPEVISVGKMRTALGVPLLRAGEPMGVLYLARQRVEPFSERQIELVRIFADQAVIAIENARLLNEIRQRQEELRITFENMGDGVALFDGTPRLVAWNRKFQDILDLPDGVLAERLTFAEYVRYLTKRGEYGAGADPEKQIRQLTENIDQYRSFERVRPDRRVIEVRHNPVPAGGFVLIYADITERKRNEAEIRVARDAAEEASRTIEAAYRDLKAAQANLIQAEKMASLGQLTAGIAHEIKNPLNFVNNFASLSVDLLDELKEIAAPAFATLDVDRRADIDDLATTLTGNLAKIAEHGRRADGIVRSMLEHSRGTSGERRAVDLNALVDEALNLAYHGARAQDQNFNVAMERNFAEGMGQVELMPQDMTRVLLNLFGNGFYAANKRARNGADTGVVPTLNVTTRDLGEVVEMRVRDNGTGIPDDIRDKLFQPFFTTKPTGEGTGLGLSISYDIVTQQHGGSITVDSKVDEYSEFTIRLPRK